MGKELAGRLGRGLVGGKLLGSGTGAGFLVGLCSSATSIAGDGNGGNVGAIGCVKRVETVYADWWVGVCVGVN